MARYIDADKLQAEIDGENRPEINSGSEEAKWIRECIRNAPSVDVRPERHGRWEAAGNIVVECSACGEVYSAIMIPRYYCPNCGAKMDREESDLNGKINIS